MVNYTIIGGDGQQYGPVSAGELRQWIAEGRLNGQSLIQAEGQTEWKALSTFPEFATALQGQGAAPPPIVSPSVGTSGSLDEILAREPQVRIGQCLAYGWRFLGGNPGLVIGGVLIAWLPNLLATVARQVPKVGPMLSLLGAVLYLLISGILFGGLYRACLLRMRGENLGVGNVFDGFKLCAVQLLLAGVLTKILTQLGFLVCALPGLYLMVAWFFTLPLVADKRLDFWPAMELSRRVVTRIWFEVCLFLFLAFLPFIVLQFFLTLKFAAVWLEISQEAAGDLMKLISTFEKFQGQVEGIIGVWGPIIQIAFFLNLLFAVGAVARAYENLFGPRKP